MTRVRAALPEGTIPVAVGLVISGLSAYGFLAIAARKLGEEAFAPLSLLWFVTFIMAPGFFLPVEQEVGRALAARRALRQGGLPVVRRATLLAAGLAAVLVVIILALSPVLVDHLFHGSWGLLVGLLLALVGYGSGHLVRGILAGDNRFRPYGTFMAADGLLRLGGCLVFAVIGITTVGYYGLLVGLPPLIAIAIALRGQRPLAEPGPQADWGELTSNLGWLLIGSVLAAILVNAGPLAANMLASEDDKALVGRFSAGVLIARVPLFLFQAVQAALLPKLASLAAQRAFDEFRRGFKKLLVVVLAVGAIGTIAAAVLGPLVVKVFFGYELSRQTLTLLALASACYMLAVTMAQALIALQRHARVALGWALGVTAFVVVTALGSDLLLRVELGLLAGSLAALASFALTLRTSLRHGDHMDVSSLVEAIHDMPIEF